MHGAWQAFCIGVLFARNTGLRNQKPFERKEWRWRCLHNEDSENTGIPNRDNVVFLCPWNCPNIQLEWRIDMGNQLSLIKDLAGVGQALASMASSISNMRRVRKQDILVVEEALRLLKASCRAAGISALSRQAMNEMYQTLQQIQSYGYSGEMLEMAQNIWRIQYELLCSLLRNYRMA